QDDRRRGTHHGRRRDATHHGRRRGGRGQACHPQKCAGDVVEFLVGHFEDHRRILGRLSAMLRVLHVAPPILALASTPVRAVYMSYWREFKPSVTSITLIPQGEGRP